MSTPIVAQMLGDGTLDVVVGTAASWRDVGVINGSDGTWDRDWPFESLQSDTLELSSDPVPAPAVGDLGGTGDREVVVGVAIDDLGLLDDPKTVMALLYGDQQTGEMLACVDSTRIPGRRGKLYGVTRGSPIIADIDGDQKQEILIGSTRGGLFAWEPTWNSSADSFECVPESGWPLVFPEEPLSPVVGDLEGDGWLELVVAAGDHVYVYDLPALNVQVLWPMPGYDVQRRGNVGGGGGQRPAPPGPGDTVFATRG